MSGPYIAAKRGSAAPMEMKCAGSGDVSAAVLIDSSDSAGLIGTVQHKISESIVLYKSVPENWKDICAAYGLDENETAEVGRRLYAVRDFWRVHGSSFPEPQVEKALEAEIETSRGKVFLSCHLDVMDRVEDEGLILDWKGTRLDINYAPQMQFYSWVYMLNEPEIQRVRCTLAFLQDRTVDVRVYTRDMIDVFVERYTKEVIEWDHKTLRPGGHCAWCKRFHTCPTQTDMIAPILDQLQIVDSTGEIQAESLLEYYERSKVIKNLCVRFGSFVHATVEAAGGEIIFADGRRLALTDEGRDDINAKLSWPILRKILSDAQLADIMKLAKGDMLRAIADAAPRGEKGKAKTNVMQELRDAGAVKRTEFKKLHVYHSKKKESAIGEIENSED
jgi:hypothetical protein